MDNPYYFYQDPRLPLQPSLVLATLKVNDSEARKALDQNLGMLNSRLESPSLKLVKRCSLKKFFGKNSKLKRSQSLTHEKDSNFAVERSKSFSSRTSCAADARTWTSSANPKSAAVSHENTRRSWGSPTSSTSVCVQRQRSIQVDDITIINSQMASVALMQQRTRPPLPPATRSPMNVRQDDLIQLRQKHKLKMSTPPPLHPAKCDVAVIYSSRCQVSGEWARFIVALMKQQGYQNVVSQCIESEFLDDNANAPKVFQARAQIVILGQAFLDWLYVHPGSHIGTLFKDGTKVIGLLLGVTKDQVKAEHRAELLTFAVWKFLFAIRAKEHESLAKSLINAVSSMMPPSKSSGNTSASYVLPRPLKKFKIWSATDGVKSHEKILLFLNDKIQSSDLDKVQVTIEVLQDSIPRQRVSPESVALVNESSLEIMLPEINGNGIKLSLEIGGFKWHPDCINSTIKVVANQLHELDRTLSHYLEQLHCGSIQLDGKDRNCPTLLHFAAKQQMTQVVTQLLKLPDLGGLQMSSILNQDGLSPRDLAVQAGNLELAKLLKNPDKPKQNYELPVLKAKSEDLYDIPRQVENCYVVPPPPRPVVKSKSQIKEAYLPMQPARKLSLEATTEKQPPPKLIIDEPPRPQSRQEFLKSLFKDEVSSEDSNSSKSSGKAENSDGGCESQPKSPLIVKPFPMIVPQEKKSLEESTLCQLQEIELKIANKQMNFKTFEEKFSSWQKRPDVLFGGPSEVESLKKRWMDLFEKFPNQNEDKRKDKSWKFFKKSKKYSTLPSMPFRKKSNSTNSIPEGSALKEHRFKTSSLSESEWSPSSSTEKIDKKNNYDNVSVMEPGDVRISD